MEKSQNSTPRHTKTPKPIFTKIVRLYYVLDGTRHANFVAIGLGVSAPQIRDFAVSFDVTSMFVFGFYSLHP